MNRFVWNLRYPDATTFPGLIMWAGSVTGPRVSPGTYTGAADGRRQVADPDLRGEEGPAPVHDAPRTTPSSCRLALQIRDKLSETNEGVIQIRELRKQLDEYAKRSDKRVADAAKALMQEADRGGGGALPDQEPRQRRSAELPHQAEQQAGARAGRRGELRQPAHRAIVHGVRGSGHPGERRTEDA